VPLSKQIGDALLPLRDRHMLDDPVFWGSRPIQPLGHAGFLNIVRKALKNTDMEGKMVSPHTLSYTFSTNWITQGGEAVSLKNIMGHLSLERTQQYVSSASEDLVSRISSSTVFYHLLTTE